MDEERKIVFVRVVDANKEDITELFNILKEHPKYNFIITNAEAMNVETLKPVMKELINECIEEYYKTH